MYPGTKYIQTEEEAKPFRCVFLYSKKLGDACFFDEECKKKERKYLGVIKIFLSKCEKNKDGYYRCV